MFNPKFCSLKNPVKRPSISLQNHRLTPIVEENAANLADELNNATNAEQDTDNATENSEPPTKKARRIDPILELRRSNRIREIPPEDVTKNIGRPKRNAKKPKPSTSAPKRGPKKVKAKTNESLENREEVQNDGAEAEHINEDNSIVEENDNEGLVNNAGGIQAICLAHLTNFKAIMKEVISATQEESTKIFKFLEAIRR
uniref:Uncharacterized protein n=1 Tax=Panagrolaimus sp. ES5 TaxID=591445 RepID=A0AC34G6J2_9BILA